jgi:hypothetical protein
VVCAGCEYPLQDDVNGATNYLAVVNGCALVRQVIVIVPSTVTTLFARTLSVMFYYFPMIGFTDPDSNQGPTPTRYFNNIGCVTHLLVYSIENNELPYEPKAKRNS